MDLWPFQQEAVEGVRAHIRAGERRVMLCAPTGAGKTVMGRHIIQEAVNKGSRAAFIVDRVSLINQTSAAFDQVGIPHGVIQADHWRYRPHESVQVASVQTLQRRRWPPFDLVIVDEAHSLYKVVTDRIKLSSSTVWVGLSATPFTKGLGRYYGGLVNATTTATLIDEGYLSPYRIFAPSEPDMKGAKVSAGEWTDRDREERSIPIIGDVVQQYLTHAHGRKFICFGSTVAHCEEIQRQFLAAGIPTGLYSYLGTGEEKSSMIEDFRQPDSPLQGLISVSALAKGFDVPSVSCVIVCRPLRSSFTEHVQMIGRGLRADPDDPEKVCLILDHAGNTVRFADQMDQFFYEGATKLDDGRRKEKAKGQEGAEPRMRKCGECHHVHKTAPRCPNCGHEYPKPIIEHEDGELIEVGTSRAEAAETMRDWYSQLLGLAHSRGYKMGWAAHKYRERFGKWPPRGMKEAAIPEPASVEVARWVQSRQIAWAKSRKRGTA